MVPVDHLKNLGSQSTQYAYDAPRAEMLETFDTPHPNNIEQLCKHTIDGFGGVRYKVEHVFEEFTSLCPKTGQPDFAKISIEMIPDKKCVETKSLKLYFFAYRNVGEFMESITNRICMDLVIATAPFECIVNTVFGARGGIVTKVYSKYTRPNIDSDAQSTQVKRLVAEMEMQKAIEARNDWSELRKDAEGLERLLKESVPPAPIWEQPTVTQEQIDAYQKSQEAKQS